MSHISEHAVIDPKARIGADVCIGPFCVIGPDVVLGDRCHLMNNVTVQGVTVIGANNIFFPNSVIGVAPQDLKYKGAPTQTIIGNDNTFRENVTVHRGTELGGGKTVIGSGNLIMVSAHIAHDCIVEDGIIIGNQTQLAGHVKIERGAVITALVGLHHFVTVGRFSYIAGLTPVRRDVPPFVKFSGDPNEVRAVNEEGLRRHHFTEQDITEIKEAFRRLFRNEKGRTVLAALDRLEAADSLNEHVRYMCRFMRASCQSRFGRFRELARSDSPEDRQHQLPPELQTQ